jgi:hypothetical protein
MTVKKSMWRVLFLWGLLIAPWTVWPQQAAAPQEAAPQEAAAQDYQASALYAYKIDWDHEPYIDHYELIVQKQGEGDADGVIGAWREVVRLDTKENYADINLEHGVYRFSVRAVNVLGIAGELSAWRVFSINPPALPPQDTPPPPDGPAYYSFGIAPEANMNSDPKNGRFVSLGGAISFETGIFDNMGAGVSAHGSYNIQDMLVFEAGIFLRWYPVNAGVFRLFLEAGTGISALFKSDDKTIWTALGALSAGVRLTFGKFYAEPYIRAGYPFMLGAGAGFGIQVR